MMVANLVEMERRPVRGYMGNGALRFGGVVAAILVVAVLLYSLITWFVEEVF